MVNDLSRFTMVLVVLSVLLVGCQKETSTKLPTAATKPLSPESAAEQAHEPARVERVVPPREFDPNDPFAGTGMERPKSIDTTDIVEVTLTINGQEALKNMPVVPADEELQVEASVKVNENLAHLEELPDAVKKLVKNIKLTPYVTVNTTFASRLEGRDDWQFFKLLDTDVFLRLRTQKNDPLKAQGKQELPYKLKSGEYQTRLYMSFHQNESLEKLRWVAEGRLKVIEQEPDLNTPQATAPEAAGGP